MSLSSFKEATMTTKSSNRKQAIQGPDQKVPEGFVPHSPFYYIARHLEILSHKNRSVILKHWARVFGLTIVELKKQLKAAQ